MTNIKRLENAKKELETMAEMLEQIINGNMTQSQMARQLGINPQSLNHELNVGCFSNYLRKKDILTQKDILKCMIDAETPCEKIVRDIFGITDKEKILFIEPELQKEFIKEMKKTLTEEQWRIISLRYGFEEKPMTYQEIGETIGISRERVGNLIVSGLWKLRRPSHSRFLFSNYQRYIILLEKTDRAKRIYERLKDSYNSALTEYLCLLRKLKLIDATPQMKEEFERFLLLQDFPEIPRDWIYAFSELGINSVFDYLEADKDVIEKILRKCPDFSVKRMQHFLYEPKNMNLTVYLREMDIKNVGFSTRTSNALYRNGIYTVEELVRHTKKDIMKIKFFGKNSWNEIEKFLKEHDLQLADK